MAAKLGVSMFLRRLLQTSSVYRSNVLTEETSFHRVTSKLELVDSSKGKVFCELAVDQEHLNRGGNLHGGMTATLVDEVTTLAIMMDEKPPGVTVDLSVTYMSAAKEGDVLTINAECVKSGRNMAFATADIINKKSGKLIAQGKQTKYIGS